MIKKHAPTILGLLLLAVLLTGAFAAPGMVNRIYDSRTLGQLKTQEINLNPYELTYDSFEEKLHTIGMVLSGGATIELVELMEDTSSYQAITDEELTELAKKEVDLLLNEALGMDVEISPENLWERRLFTVFGKSLGNNENILSGIHIYKLSYEIPSGTDKDGAVLSLYMDSEFYKLYAFALDSASALYWTNTLLVLQEKIPEILADYWEIEQEYVFVDKNEEIEKKAYFESGSSWGIYDEAALVFEDGVRIYLWRALRVFKYGMSINIGIDPFVYSY